jgi:hypothetical protein
VHYLVQIFIRSSHITPYQTWICTGVRAVNGKSPSKQLQEKIDTVPSQTAYQNVLTESPPERPRNMSRFIHPERVCLYALSVPAPHCHRNIQGGSIISHYCPPLPCPYILPSKLGLLNVITEGRIQHRSTLCLLNLT